MTEELFFQEVWDIYCLSKKTEEVFNQFQKRFLSDFSEETKYLKERSSKKQDNPSTDEDEEKEQLDEKYAKLYKKIVKITHPDKDVEKKHKDLFLAATDAKENNQWQIIFLIASKLSIDIPVLTFQERKGITNFGRMYSNRTAQMKNSHEWQWNMRSETKKELFKIDLYEKFDIDKDIFDKWRISNETK